MKDKSDSDYEDFISYLRYVCDRPQGFGPSFTKVRKMVASWQFENIDKAIEWMQNEWNKSEPIRKDNEIARFGSDEEVIKLAERLGILKQFESE